VQSHTTHTLDRYKKPLLVIKPLVIY